ncbi:MULTISPECIES: monovalent cation/H+ antiporter complex subunit F [Arthrobacter]|uniref:monovalent cation/H+ antiporter complex subunit F n=1 Tax=unclassified Arthrobacter TaxID=235627 RepID=UPI0024BB33D3|nr:monovalent cation/H+ antiporter complex subunit F [Arthrobacter sp. H35-MC1]MDJ0318459.1 monovalent cation/H+ antiporter complex subunit F [Arthrobacter sp. H35-MC1]
MTVLEIIAIIVAVVLSLAGAGTIYRIAKGPSLLDRVIAADVLLAIFGAALATEMAVNKHMDNLALLVVLTVIGFLGSVTVARFVGHKKEDA